ncbi:MAG TPA: hypothetical protein VFI37_08760 [Gaiellaceae bacterium]|jgi:hypothetical protein|nr:hypothetical protein [Gaiellaceae bacterium]
MPAREEPSRALAAIVDEARAEVAAGREPDAAALERRLREAGGDEPATRRALEQLGRVLAVHRARALLAQRPSAPAARAPVRRRGMLRSRPTITGNMDVRKQADGGSVTLSWDAAARVSEWEVRFSERPDPRSDYVVRETRTLPATATEVTLPPLGELPFRVTLLGRARDGRLLRRALISGLTSETWQDRWQRKASAS